MLMRAFYTLLHVNVIHFIWVDAFDSYRIHWFGVIYYNQQTQTFKWCVLWILLNKADSDVFHWRWQDDGNRMPINCLPIFFFNFFIYLRLTAESKFHRFNLLFNVCVSFFFLYSSISNLFFFRLFESYWKSFTINQKFIACHSLF